MSDIAYRRAKDGDLERTWDVATMATNAVLALSNLPLTPAGEPLPPRALASRQHALKYDPERFWVAEADGQVVGYGVVTRRQNVYILADLQIMPAYHGRGVGSSLLEHCFGARYAPNGHIWLTMTDGTYPVANGLYGRFGMYPWLVLTSLAGPLPTDTVVVEPEFANTARRLSNEPADLAALGSIDQQVLGLRRDADHQQWLAQPDMVGYLFAEPSSPHGAPAGYAYFSKPGRSYLPTAGAIGPVAMAAEDERFTVKALAYCLARMQQLELTEVRLRVPGSCRESIRYLLAQGLRYERPTLLLASEPFARVDRYIPSGSDALF